jgi:hypothetical protein
LFSLHLEGVRDTRQMWGRGRNGATGAGAPNGSLNKRSRARTPFVFSICICPHLLPPTYDFAFPLFATSIRAFQLTCIPLILLPPATPGPSRHTNKVVKQYSSVAELAMPTNLKPRAAISPSRTCHRRVRSALDPPGEQASRSRAAAVIGQDIVMYHGSLDTGMHYRETVGDLVDQA